MVAAGESRRQHDTDHRGGREGPVGEGPGGQGSSGGRRTDRGPAGRSAAASGQLSGTSNLEVRVIPAARPLPATTRAIFRLASSIISSPSIAEPFFPPASEVQ